MDSPNDGLSNQQGNINTPPVNIPVENNDETKKLETVENEKIENDPFPTSKSNSMCNLIIWNITKAIEYNCSIDLKCSIRAAQRRLEDEETPRSIISKHPEEQHLQCALLAWQQLGHKDADSLYNFIENHIKEEQTKKTKEDLECSEICKPSKIPHTSTSTCCTFRRTMSYSTEPLVKLPVETKFIMRVQNTPPKCAMSKRICGTPKKICNPPKKECGDKQEILNKLDSVCCLDSNCAERLAEIDAVTVELRKRAENLARRDAARMELLERAENAWKDLELGYQRRLSLAEEKEEDLKNQIEKTLAERNSYKNVCTDLSKQVQNKSEVAEIDKAKLTTVEKDLYEKVRSKLKLSEECKRAESALVEQQCRAGQLERDLQLKEEQMRRKLSVLEKDLETIRVLTLDSERATRTELSTLREQFDHMSKKLVGEDEAMTGIIDEIDHLRVKKESLIKAMDECKEMCDNKTLDKIEEFNKLRTQLKELKEKVIDCQCKLPVEVEVEVKRTPSLAALCRCAPEDRLFESCSCTSLRSRLISDLMAQLFEGLQSELGDTGSEMPCQLLKCLEDNHNWDRSSEIKNNLRDYYSRLLVGELDIAIATSIENYHAQWIGTTCADAPKMKPGPEDDQDVGWEQRAVERRAQEMASQLAEQLFQDRQDEVLNRAKKIVMQGPPSCSCGPPTRDESVNKAVFPVLIQSKMKYKGNLEHNGKLTTVKPADWKRTIHDVTEIKQQIEDLRKDIIKKKDLKLMENKFLNLVKQSPATQSENRTETRKNNGLYTNSNKGRNTLDSNNSYQKSFRNEIARKPCKNNSLGQTYSVNVCLCDQKNTNKSKQKPKINKKDNILIKNKQLKDVIRSTTSVKQTKPIDINISQDGITEINNLSVQPYCTKEFKCFHKIPSNKSIDRLFDALTKWNNSSVDIHEYCIKETDNVETKIYHKKNIADTAIEKKQTSRNEIINKIDLQSKNPHLYETCVTESVYMGAIVLNKSVENLIKPQESNKGDPYVSALQILNLNEDNHVMPETETIFTDIIENSDKLGNHDETETRENISNKFKGCQDHYDNSINFLGVTLTNVNTGENNTDNNTQKYKNLHNSMCDLNIQTSKNEYSVNLEKYIDSQSLKQSEKSTEACVCANYFNTDNLNDLEYNTFNLLENHLRGKLDEFKLCKCKSSCISPEEEDKIFSTVLNKVKHVISDCASNIKCSCQKTKDGSWSRVHGLLQEYLKIKIKRVSCICEQKSNSNEMLPNILEKVCDLIENDFQRLKSICKCKNVLSNELPEKYINYYDKSAVNILTANISCQVPRSLGMKNMSCDIINSIIIKEEQSTETDTILTVNRSLCVLLKNHECNHCYNFKHCCNELQKSTKHLLDPYKANDIMVNNVYTNAVTHTSVLEKSIKPVSEQRFGLWYENPNIIYKQYSDVCIEVRANEEMKLKDSGGKLNTNHKTTNTINKIEKYSISEGRIELRPRSVKLTTPINFTKSTSNNVTLDHKKSTLIIDAGCSCDKIPICHVKMLVENIEKKLIDCKCTCDSLTFKVCPVHSKGI